MLRKTYIILCAVLFAVNIFAQAPLKMSYQAVVRDAGNNLIINQSVGVQISILKNSPYGTVVYQELHSPNPQTNGNGLLTLEIGTGTPSVGTFAGINWSSGAYFIKSEIDPLGGTAYTITCTSQMMSVPYALYAKTAGNGFSGSYNDLTNKPQGNAIGDMQYWDGSAWVLIPGGQPGQYLQLTASKTPAWTGKHFPIITTSAVSDITRTSATCGGNVTSNGGDTVKVRGICWSTTANPTIANSKTIDGDGTGVFTSSITGLSDGVTYYVKAYATNNLGTSYGPQISFTTVIGHVSYTLYKSATPTAEELNAYTLITKAMDSAIWYYNKYTTITKALNIYYVPGVATADGNINGTIRFGSVTTYMHKVTAMHEIGHTVGVGTSGSWSTLMVGGLYTGTNGNNVLRSITGVVTDQVHGDGAHFWPYGLNYQSEYKSTADLINHCRIVSAMKQDGM